MITLCLALSVISVLTLFTTREGVCGSAPDSLIAFPCRHTEGQVPAFGFPYGNMEGQGGLLSLFWAFHIFYGRAGRCALPI